MSTDEHEPQSGSFLTQLLFADPSDGPLPFMLILLTVLTGIVDAIAILRLGRVFVANMTGNVAFLAFAVAGARGFSLSASLVALAGFLAGAGFGGKLSTRMSGDRVGLLRDCVAIELALLTGSLVIALVTHQPLGSITIDVLAGLCAFSMGLQNAVARRLVVADLTTSVLTMTLVGLVASPSRAQRTTMMTRRVLAVCSIFAGALVGTILILREGVTSAFAAAVGVATIVLVSSVIAARRPGEWRAPR